MQSLKKEPIYPFLIEIWKLRDASIISNDIQSLATVMGLVHELLDDMKLSGLKFNNGRASKTIESAMVCLLHQIVAICSNRASDLVQLNTIRQHLRSNTCQDNLAKHRVRYLEAKLDADRIHYRFMVERIENTFQPGSDAQPVFRRSLDIQTIRLNMPPKPKDPKKSLEPEGLVFSNDHDVFEPGSNEESDFESESEETDSEDNQPKLKLKKKQKGSFPRPALHKRLVENFKDVSPRSKYSDEVQQYLRRWLADHRDSPYPSLGEKKAIAKRIGLSLTQVTNWFINARRRYMKN